MQYQDVQQQQQQQEKEWQQEVLYQRQQHQQQEQATHSGHSVGISCLQPFAILHCTTVRLTSQCIVQLCPVWDTRCASPAVTATISELLLQSVAAKLFAAVNIHSSIHNSFLLYLLTHVAVTVISRLQGAPAFKACCCKAHTS